MNEYVDSIRKKLDTVVNQLNEQSRLFVNNPGKDFIRKRKLDFKEMVNILLTMGDIYCTIIYGKCYIEM